MTVFALGKSMRYDLYGATYVRMEASVNIMVEHVTKNT